MGKELGEPAGMGQRWGSLGGGAPGAGEVKSEQVFRKQISPLLASTFYRNAARPERQQHPLLPAPEKEGWGGVRAGGERNGLGNSCFTLQALGDILHSPPKGLEPSP